MPLQSAQVPKDVHNKVMARFAPSPLTSTSPLGEGRMASPHAHEIVPQLGALHERYTILCEWQSSKREQGFRDAYHSGPNNQWC
jgi:hypothetical protein